MTTSTYDDIRRDPAAFLAAVDRGEPVSLSRPDRVVAQVVPSPTAGPPPGQPRPVGLCKGQFVVPDDFDDPLPDDIIDTFYDGSIYPGS